MALALPHLVRIREAGLKRLEWRAEREHSSRWGSKVEHKQDLSLSITVNRSLPEQSIIDGECVTLALPKKEK